MQKQSPQRRRLAELMEQRRLELGLTWQQVADAGDVSVRSIHAARTGTADIRPLTARGISTGLRWAPDSVKKILTKREPEPLHPEAAEPASPRESPSPPPLEDARRDVIAALRTLTPGSTPDAVAAEVEAARRRYGPNPSPEQVFPGPDMGVERSVWDMRTWRPEAELIQEIAAYRTVRTSYGTGRARRTGTGLLL